MCVAINGQPIEIPLPQFRQSLNQETRDEIGRFKWYRSEEAGYDVGEVEASRSWVRAHWNGFLRAKWLEHLEGVKYWVELGHDDYGLLHRIFHDSQYVVEIVHQLKLGGENLTIIGDALERGWPIDQVIRILAILDINSRRLAWSVAKGLVPYD